MTPGPLLLSSALGLLASIVLGPRWPRLWLALVLTGTAAALAAAVQVFAAPLDWEWRSAFLLGDEPLHLRLDGLSALFLVPLCVVGGAGAAYAREYWADDRHPDSAGRGRAWWGALVLSMGLVLVSSNGLHFLIAWESFAISAYFLITLDRQRREVLAAGWLYLVASHTGTLCLFAFFASIAAHTGSWDLRPLREHAELAPLFWLALFGFGVKAGLFPLHVWLPSAHANAPSHVSAIMSGVAIKMGVYGIVRFSGWLPVPAATGWVVIGLGSVGACLGIAFALAQDDLKRLLAYCSVENVGIILIGLGTALLATTNGDAPWGRLALAGALLHVWNHGAFKSLLFLSAGSVLHATGTREMSRLGGLWRAMPWTAGLFVLASVSVAGLPPLNGFVSEWLTALGLFGAVTSQAPSAWSAMPAAILIAFSGALALASFVKAGAVVFLGSPRTRAAARAHECGSWMRGPMLALAGACVVIGLAPVLFWPVLSHAVGAWHPAWASIEPPAPLLELGVFHIVLAALALAGVAWLRLKTRANGLRLGPTWDCGYAAPTPRMQTTSASFAAIATSWFSWILQRERRLRRPRGPLPATASWVERIPETVLERVIAPAGGAVLLAASAARRLQHGRLQSYVLYLMAGLAALGVFVALGSMR